MSFPTFSFIVGTTDYGIDKFITAVHGENYGRSLSQRISIPVGVIMHLNALRFELDDRNNYDALPDTAMIVAIDIEQLIFMRSLKTNIFAILKYLKRLPCVN